MKKLMIVAVLVLALARLVFPQNFVEDLVSFSPGGKISHQIDVYANGQFTPKIGWYIWSLNGQFWSEAYAGPTLSVFSWCQFGAGYGVQTGSNPNRYGSFVWLGKGRLSFIGFYEAGNGYWHRQVVNCRVWKTLGAGAFNETVAGLGRRIGPRAEFTVYKLRFWGTVFPGRSFLGVNFLF